MRSYDERVRKVFEEGDAIIAARKKHRSAIIRRTVYAVSGLCAAAVIGLGIWHSSAIKGALTPDPDHGYADTIDTQPTTAQTTETTSSQPAITTTRRTTAVTTTTKPVTSAETTSVPPVATHTTAVNSTAKTSSSRNITSSAVRTTSTAPTVTTTAAATTTTARLTTTATTTCRTTVLSTYTIPVSTNLARTIRCYFGSEDYYYYNMGFTVPTTAVDTELGTTPTGYQRDSAVFSIKNTLPDTALAVFDDEENRYVLFYDLFRFYTSPDNGKRYKCKEGGPVYEENRQFLRTEEVIESMPEIGFAFAHTVDVYTVNGISPDVLLAIRTDGNEFINAYYGGLDSPQTLRDIYDALAVEQYISYVTHVNIIYDDHILEYSIKNLDKNKEFFDTMLLSELDLPVTKTPPEIHSGRIMQTHIQLGGISFSIKVEITEDGWMTLDMLGDKYYCFIGSEKFGEYESYLKKNSNVRKNQKYY